MTEYKVTVHYSERMLKMAVRTFVWRRLKQELDWKLMLALAVVSGTFSATLWYGDRSWVVGLLGMLLLFVFLMPLLVYRAHMKNTLGRFRAMRNPQATYIFCEPDFFVESDSGLSRLPWSAIIGLWKLPDCWLLLLAHNQFITLPTAHIAKEILEYVRSKIAQK